MSQDSSHLNVLRRFANFWSSVSKLQISKDVPADTQAAIVRGYERAYGPEEQGRERDISG